MERNRAKSFSEVNKSFQKALEDWQKHPGDPIAIRWFNEHLSWVDVEKANMTLKIFTSALETSEGARAILPTDLKKWTRREGEFIVKEFHPKKREVANARVMAIKDFDGNGVLVILNNEYGEYGRQATLFPREIAGIMVR